MLFIKASVRKETHNSSIINSDSGVNQSTFVAKLTVNKMLWFSFIKSRVSFITLLIT